MRIVLEPPTPDVVMDADGRTGMHLGDGRPVRTRDDGAIVYADAVDHASGLCCCGDEGAGHDGLRMLLGDPTQDALAAAIAEAPESAAMAMLWMAEALGWTEHGVSASGSWLTGKGRAIVAALEGEHE